MMRYVLSVTAAMALAVASTVHPAAQAPAQPAGRSQGAAVRIGVFDSRVVAIAYYNGPEFQASMQKMRAELDAAKTAGDKARVAQLEYQGPAIQSLMHYQVFSNASIPNVTEKLDAVLPKVAREAGVQILVSKWDVAFRDAGVEYVDVTSSLVREFNPSARVQQMIAQSAAHPPMSLMEAVRTLRPDR